jgi:hypothetical protein
MKSTVPKIGLKCKEKGKDLELGARKKTKVHKVPPIYNSIDEYINQINYQVWDFAEEFMEETMRKQEE